MNSSSNKGAVSRRRIARLLARGLRWTPVVAILLTSQANAQTSVSQMAYRRDDVIPVLLDCEAGCYLELNLVPYIVTPLATVAEGYEPTWSPDATQIAFTDSYNSDIYVISASGGNAVNLTNSGLIPPYPSAFHPAWSPDGAQIAFARSTSTSTEIYVVNSDGSGLRRLTYGIALNVGHPAWSPDSARIAFDCEVENGNWDICTMNRDGSGVVRLTTAPGADSNPVWSPDGNRMAFSSDQFGAGNLLALMNRDGSGVSQIGVGIQGWPSSWSPDGAQIAFTGYGDPQQICGGGTPGGGGPVCLTYYLSVINTTTPDGAVVTRVVDSGGDPAWMPMPVPVATFTFTCSGSTCDFDASGSRDSYGTITDYAWNFGDGTTGAGARLTHTYAAGGSFTVTLTVTDNNGATGTRIQTITTYPVAAFTSSCDVLTCSFDGSVSQGNVRSYAWTYGDGLSGTGMAVSHTYGTGGDYVVTLTVVNDRGTTATASQHITLNSPPAALFTSTCIALTCTFNTSGSSDLDGTIVNYVWNFGDGRIGSGATLTHSYAVGGSYAVTLLVTDNGGATGTRTMTVTVIPPSIHIGDLDGTSMSNGPIWTATVTITVHDGAHVPVANAVVSGTWNDGSTGSCATDAIGRCAVARLGIPRRIGSVRFAVTNDVLAGFIYKPSGNHDPDGDSDGTTITIAR